MDIDQSPSLDPLLNRLDSGCEQHPSMDDSQNSIPHLTNTMSTSTYPSSIPYLPNTLSADTSSSNISCLPTPLLLHIISELPLLTQLQLMLVNKWFESSARDNLHRHLKHLPLQDIPVSSLPSALQWAIRPDHYPLLQSLHIYGHSSGAALLEAFSNSIQSCPRLTDLIVEHDRALRDAHVTAITSRWPQLSTLSLANCLSLTDVSAQSISQHCSRLRSVNFTNCILMTDAAMVAVANGCKQLKAVIVTGCQRLTDESGIAVSRGLPQLEEWRCGNCTKMTDNMSRAMQACSKLKHFDATQCRLIRLEVLSTCTQLTSLQLSGGRYEYSRAAKLIHSVGHSIVHLKLSTSSALSGSILPFIAQHCPRLETLDVARLPVDDKHLRAFSSHSPSLKVLSLEWCGWFTDEGIMSVAHGCKSLVALSLEGVYCLTDACLPVLAAQCTSLECLNLRMCSSLTSTGVIGMVKASRKLTTVHLAGLWDADTTSVVVNELRKLRPSCILKY